MLELISADDVKKRGHSEYVKFNHNDKKQDWLNTLNDTKERRKNQICKTYEIKIDKSHLNNETENQLEMLSLEAKWYCNHIRSKIDWNTKEQENLFDMDYKIDKVAVKVGYRYEIRELKYLSSQMKQELLDRIKDDVIRLSEKKERA